MALENLQTNMDRNRKTLDENSGKVHVTELTWGTDLEKHPKYQVILGADIIYIEETFKDLLKTLKHLSSTDTVVFLSCKIRYEKDSKFLVKLRKTFLIEEVLYDSARDIRVYRATLRS